MGVKGVEQTPIQQQAKFLVVSWTELECCFPRNKAVLETPRLVSAALGAA
jgi:hypothetical protein